MKLKEVCERTGLTKRTIRFYEEKELLSPQKTYKNGREYRDYSEDDVARLKDIATLRRARFTIQEIKQMEMKEEAKRQIDELLGRPAPRVRNVAVDAGDRLRDNKGRTGSDVYKEARDLQRKLDASKRDALLSAIRKSRLSSVVRIYEEDAGLHFILEASIKCSDSDFCRQLRQKGVNIKALSEYYFEAQPSVHKFVINYSSVDKRNVQKAVQAFALLCK